MCVFEMPVGRLGILMCACIWDVMVCMCWQGLRFNRCLLSLSLAYNCIGDAGTKSLAGVSGLISMITRDWLFKNESTQLS